MNETGLIVAEVVFLVLLYAFVWSVVRSSSRQLRTAQPPPAAAPDPAAMAVTPAPPVAPPPPAPAAAPVTVPAAVAPPPEPLTVERTEPPADDDVIDLHGNIEPRLIVEVSEGLEPGRTIPLETGITIGRSDGADLTIDDLFVSHMHARILQRGAYHFVEDLGSTNGTFLNDRRVESDAQLKVHDALRIGQTTLRYEE